jgi:hypothetical protein
MQSSVVRQQLGTGGPARQTPVGSHESGPVQRLLSALQAAPTFTVYSQPSLGLQPATVRHGFVTEQSTDCELHRQRPVAGSNVPVSCEHLLPVLQNTPQ